MGAGNHPAQNPPRLDELEVETLSFYNANATAFVRDFGLMEGLVASCGVSGVAKEIFLERLGVIHQDRLEREMKQGG